MYYPEFRGLIIRGIEQRKIFRDDWDREDPPQRLSNLLTATQTFCCAWVLIPNHTHFLFCTGSVSLAALMRRILTGYAVSFNRRLKL
jgi:REP element-mobilizing transposase RayT